MKLDVAAHPEGTILPVRAHAGGRANEVRGVEDGALRVSVTQSPEKGKANKALIDVMSRRLKLRKSQFALLSGETSRQKKFLVRGITPEELTRVVERCVAEP